MIQNNCNFIGRTTREIELRFTQSGMAVANGSMTVDGYKKDSPATFVNFKVFNKSAETIANYVKKGKLLAISGNLKIEEYENKQGQKVRNPVIIVESFKILEWGEKKEQSKQDNSNDLSGLNENANSLKGFLAINSDDDIPF